MTESSECDSLLLVLVQAVRARDAAAALKLLAIDKNGVTPLHRAVRTRCAAAVAALHDGGADALASNSNGSVPMRLATLNTGRGGSGSPEAKARQQEIAHLLEQHGATKP